MPWLSRTDYTQLVRENERAKAYLVELERLRAQVKTLTGDRDRERAAFQAEMAELRQAIAEDFGRELQRNRTREDLLLDRVLTSKGAYPVSPQAERKSADKPPAPPVPLNGIEEATLKMYMESAVERGFSPEIGRRMFERDRGKRLNPEMDMSAYKDLPILQPPDEITEEEIDS